MRRILFFLLILIPHLVYCLNLPIDNMEMETLHIFEYGDGLGQLGYIPMDQGDEPSGPTDILVDNNMYWIRDYHNSRTIGFSFDFSRSAYLLSKFSWSSLPGILESYDQGLVSIDKTGTKVQFLNLINESIDFNFEGLNLPTNFFSEKGISRFNIKIFKDFVLYISNEIDKIVVITISNPDDQKVLLGFDALDFIESEGFNVKIEYDKFLLIDNELITRNPKQFIEYWINKDEKKYTIDFLQKKEIFESSVFSGVDNDGNYYWTAGSGIWIFNKSGDLLKIVLVSMNESTNSDMLRFSIDEEGNVYRLVRAPNGYQLRYLEKKW